MKTMFIVLLAFAPASFVFAAPGSGVSYGVIYDHRSTQNGVGLSDNSDALYMFDQEKLTPEIESKIKACSGKYTQVFWCREVPSQDGVGSLVEVVDLKCGKAPSQQVESNPVYPFCK